MGGGGNREAQSGNEMGRCRPTSISDKVDGRYEPDRGGDQGDGERRREAGGDTSEGGRCSHDGCLGGVATARLNCLCHRKLRGAVIGHFELRTRGWMWSQCALPLLCKKQARDRRRVGCDFPGGSRFPAGGMGGRQMRPNLNRQVCGEGAAMARGEGRERGEIVRK